jgi:ferric-dicitrate binding protein FerR (iron transport regulator)
MTRHSPDPTEGVSRAELEALRWVVRMTSGEAGAAEQAALADWCARAPENRPALASACRLWAATGPALRAVRKSQSRPQWRTLALAASLLLLVSLGYRLLGGREPAAPAVAQLADAGGYCRLLLGEGDASFDVTPDPGGGAIDETRVRVLGAAFSLRPYAAGVLVTVTGGNVEYKDGKGLHVIAAGQQLRCNAARRTAAAAPRPLYGLPGRGARALLAGLYDKLAKGQTRHTLRILAASN